MGPRHMKAFEYQYEVSLWVAAFSSLILEIFYTYFALLFYELSEILVPENICSRDYVGKLSFASSGHVMATGNFEGQLSQHLDLEDD